MPILTDAAEEELNASGGLDLCLELVTLVDQVWYVSIEDVYVLGSISTERHGMSLVAHLIPPNTTQGNGAHAL